MIMKGNKKPLAMIFDGNHLLYRAYHKFSQLRNFRGEKTSIIYGVPYIIESIIRTHKPSKVLVIFDGGRDPYRKKIHPEYKSGRDKNISFDKEDFYKQRDVVIEILLHLGVKVAKGISAEADDTITLAVKRLKKTHNIYIVSGDKDFNQLIEIGVSILNTHKGIKYSHNNLKYYLGYNPSQCVDYLTLLGDSSDNIPGYRGMGEKKTLAFLEKFNSIDEFIQSNGDMYKLDKPTLKLLRDKNKKLIDLRYFYLKFNRKSKIPYLVLGRDIPNRSLKEILERYEVNTFNKKEFKETFKKIN